MRRVKWVDSQGRTRISMVRDSDPDESAPQGIPIDVVDVYELDWEQIKLDLQNSLVSLDIVDWESAKFHHEHVAGAILSAVRRPLLLHLRTRERDAGNLED